MKRLASLFFLLFNSALALASTAPTAITISPQGAVLATGSSLQFTASCSYANGAQDDCSRAGGVSWSSSNTPYMTVTSSGVAKWTTDPGSGNAFAYGNVLVSVGGISDRATIIGQHVGDVFYQYPTPDYTSYNEVINNTGRPLNVVVGSTVTVGSGFVTNEPTPGNKSGNPFQMTCNWSSSNPAVATVDRHGQVTAVSPGSVSITCGRAGNGVYGTVNSSTWIAPGNVITLTVVAASASNRTWYVRPAGGTPFVSASLTPNGQCDGLHDADYPGSGVNQPCAVGNLRYLYFDGVNHHRQQWMISGGDSVIVRQNPAGYPVAYDSPYVPTNCDDSYCDVLSIPSGTPAQHTRILGENYNSCHADSAKTLLTVNGREAFNVRDSQYVDVSCFEITDKAACGPGGFTNASCPSGSSAGAYGIWESALTSNVTYNDLFIHGLVVAGIHGATGVGVVANYVHIKGMPFAGIDMDDAPWQSSNISVAGGFTMNNSITEFTGCVEEYPVTHNYPYIECRDANTGGYGDGFGTANTTGNWVFDHDIWRYNFQDGLDLLHSGMQNLSVTNSQSYGNDGQAYKLGPADSVIFRNNYALVNCNRIASTFGDEPASAIVPGVATCRAAGDWIPVNFTDQGSYIIQNNTLAGYGATPFDLACAAGWSSCTHANSVYQNNALIGYSDAAYNDGLTSATFYLENGASNMPPLAGWAVRDHNLFYNVRAANCPALNTGETCNTLDPKFSTEPGSPVSTEAALDSFSFVPAPNSPLLGAGTPIANLVADLLGDLRPSIPSIGAVDASGVSASSIQQPNPTTLTLSATPTSAVAGATVTFTASAAPAGSVVPTGTVTFLVGNTSIGTGTLNGSGVTSFSTSSFSAGTYAVTASYPGDSNFSSASSSQATVVIGAASALQPGFTAAVTPNPAVLGQTISLTASVTGPSGMVPTGKVSFVVSGKSISAQLGSSGLATASIQSLAAGSYPITASYSGDTNFNTATTSAGTLVVGSSSKGSTSLALAATPTAVTTAQAITLTATVASTKGSMPTGSVSFNLNNTTVAASLSNSGVASVSIPAITTAGNYTATAAYAGDGSFNGVSATPATVTVTAPVSPVAISVAQPANGFNVLPGSVRRVFANVSNGTTGQVTWALKSGSAQLSASSGPWVDITAGASGSTCQISGSTGVSSASQFTVEATAADDSSKKADLTFNVCKPSVQVSVVPAYRTLYANQNADLQSLVVGSANDGVQWAITSQPSNGDGKLVDASARDTVFAATVPGRYTLSATSLADGGQTATSILYVTGHNMPYRVTRNQTEPVDCSVDPALLGTTYDVGPSQTFHHLSDLPLNTMLNGSTIRLHNEDASGNSPTTFNEYLQLSQHAAPDQPIRICGVPDTAGNLPVVDGLKATGRSDVTSFAAGNGLITIGGSTSGAAWPAYNGAQNIVVEGLHLRNANAGTPYLSPSGAAATWQTSAACIRVGDGHNVSLVGNEMENCATGAASQWNGATWGGSSLNHLWEGNYIHGSGTSGSSANHQMYLQAWGQVVQFNRIDQIAAGATGANLKSRGIQDVIRYNYFGDGAARDLDLVDVGGAAQWMSFGDFFTNNPKAKSSTYSMDQLAAWQEAWNAHFAYGNIYLNSSSLAPIHFAYDQSGAEPARKGSLYWYNNTFYETQCPSCSGQLLTMFDTSGGAGTYLPQTEFPTVQAVDNVIWLDSVGQPAFQWNDFDAFIGIGASNLLPAGWGADTLQGGAGDGWNATGNAAAYQDAASLSLHITGFTGSNVQTASSIPFDKVSWLLATAENPATTSMPAEACSMPTRFTYLPILGYALPRATSPNLGATDTLSQTASLLNLLGGNNRLAVRSSNCK